MKQRKDQSAPRRIKLTASVLLTAFLGLWQALSAGGLVPAARAETPVLYGTAAALSLALLVINGDVCGAAARELRFGAPGPNCLTVLAWGLGFGAGLAGAAEAGFGSAALVLAATAGCRYLQQRPRQAAREFLRQKQELIPAEVQMHGREEVPAPTGSFCPDDWFDAAPGERFAFDGRVVQGSGPVDEEALTGRSEPVEKAPGSAVLAGTLNLKQPLVCVVEEIGAATALGRLCGRYKKVIGELSRQANRCRRRKTVLLQVLVAAAAAAVWLATGSTASGLGAALCVLCACVTDLRDRLRAVVELETVTRMTERGLLPESAGTLSALCGLKTVVMTRESSAERTPRVETVFTEGLSERFLMGIAASLCIKGSHPLSASVMEYANEREMQVRPAADFQDWEGQGMTGRMSTKEICAGTESFVGTRAKLSREMTQEAAALRKAGRRVLFVAVGGVGVGVVGCAEQAEPQLLAAAEKLGRLGLRTVLLTGCDAVSAEELRLQAGLDEVLGGLRPVDHAQRVREQQAQAPTAMIGQVLRDSAAMRAAGLSVSLGVDHRAQLCLADGRPESLAAAVELARQVQPRAAALWKTAQACGLGMLGLAALLPVLVGPYAALAGIAVLRVGINFVLLGRAFEWPAAGASLEKEPVSSAPQEEAALMQEASSAPQEEAAQENGVPENAAQENGVPAEDTEAVPAESGEKDAEEVAADGV